MSVPADSSVARYLDSLELQRKRTGIAAVIEIVAYPDGHAAIGTHPLNGREELLKAVGYLFDRAQQAAASAA